MESMTRLVVGRVDQNMSVALYETFTKMEVKEAFFQIHLIKVPSLDGT